MKCCALQILIIRHYCIDFLVREYDNSCYNVIHSVMHCSCKQIPQHKEENY